MQNGKGHRVVVKVSVEEVDALNEIWGKPFTVHSFLLIDQERGKGGITCIVLMEVLQGDRKGLHQRTSQARGGIESGLPTLIDLAKEAFPFLEQLKMIEIRQGPTVPGETAVEGEVLTEFLFSDSGPLVWSIQVSHRDGYCSAMETAEVAIQWRIHQQLDHMLTLDDHFLKGQQA